MESSFVFESADAASACDRMPHRGVPPRSALPSHRDNNDAVRRGVSYQPAIQPRADQAGGRPPSDAPRLVDVLRNILVDAPLSEFWRLHSMGPIIW